MCKIVCAVVPPVCTAYRVLRGNVRPPLQQQGDGRHMAILGRPVEGCKPTLQQQREREIGQGTGRRTTGWGAAGRQDS